MEQELPQEELSQEESLIIEEPSKIIDGDYSFESAKYDYRILMRGSDNVDGEVDKKDWQPARRAFGKNNPNIFMGWELDPEKNGDNRLIIPDYMILKHTKPEPENEKGAT